jgi:hypothetical protein
MTDPSPPVTTTYAELERFRENTEQAYAALREAAKTVADVVMKTRDDEKARWQLKPGSIVQVNPDCSHGRPGQWFNSCLVVVTEVRSWGVLGYVQEPGRPGQAHIRLAHDQFAPTGGHAVWLLPS